MTCYYRIKYTVKICIKIVSFEISCEMQCCMWFWNYCKFGEGFSFYRRPLSKRTLHMSVNREKIGEKWWINIYPSFDLAMSLKIATATMKTVIRPFGEMVVTFSLFIYFYINIIKWSLTHWGGAVLLFWHLRHMSTHCYCIANILHIHKLTRFSFRFYGKQTRRA